MKRLSVKTKFLMGASTILVLFCAVASTCAYFYLKRLVTRNIYKETEIFIETAEATRTYVKDVLRPEMLALLPSEAFIPQAMSTSYVGREIMSRLHARFPVFQYKRAARNPMNPINQADAFELSMLDWFKENPDRREWHGVIQRNSRSFYTRLRVIYAEQECLACHGDPAKSPAAMRAIYGTGGGYDYRVGEPVAADTLYIPVDVSFVRVKEAAWMVFLIAVTCLLGLMGLFHLLFNRTVVSELQGLLTTFRGISGKRTPATQRPQPVDGVDEMEALKQAFQGVAADLKQVHGELKTSEEKYRRLFQSSQDAILLFDAETHVMDINGAGLHLFGFRDLNEARSIETFYQLFWDTRDAERFFQTMTVEGSIQGFEVPMVNRQGEKLVVMISATARREKGGRLAGIDAMLRDVTAQRQMEKNLAQTEKLASIGQLASGVAHEINNPLGVIKCYANLIAKGAATPPENLADIRVIQKHTEQCKSVVAALLNFARLSEPHKAKTDLRACLEEVLAVIAVQIQHDKIRIRREYAPDLPSLTADSQKLKQVFMNLLINACQAMPEGGEIVVKTLLEKSGRRVAVIVADNGQGIPENQMDRIFDPFFTTKGPGRGTGLGLSVSYGFVKQHGGEIEVESTPGRGSRFTVWLPTETAPDPSEEARE